MNRNILLIYYQTSNWGKLQIALENFYITMPKVDRMQSNITAMSQHNPAFLLLDFNSENAVVFLREVSSSTTFSLPPYILIVASFFEGPDEATVFNLGANACVETTIDPQEVIALIHAVLCREHKVAQLKADGPLSRIKYKDLVIDPRRRTVTMRGEPVVLTKKEFDILHLLAQHTGTVLTKKSIYESVWKADYKFAETRVTDYIHSLRHKLGLNRNDSDYIQTVHRIGYRFAPLE